MVQPRPTVEEGGVVDVSGENEIRLEALDPLSEERIAPEPPSCPTDRRLIGRRMVNPNPSLMGPRRIADELLFQGRP